MADAKKRSQFLEFALIFALIYLGSQFALKTFFPQTFGTEAELTGVQLRLLDPTVKDGHHPILVIKNRTDEPLVLENLCPMPPVRVLKKEAAEFVELTAEETVLPCEYPTEVGAKRDVQIDLAPWKYSLFSEFGVYAVRLDLGGQADSEESDESEELKDVVAEFEIHKAGVFTQVFRTFISKPMLNFLVLIASKLPGYNLGIAIILLTVLIKLLLYMPTQHAMEGQRKMQAVQPHLDAVKKKHKDNPQKMQEETMKVWKEHGVNPFQSCLPMLIQFPVLIGLFFVIRDGAVLELSQHLLYGPYQGLPWTFGTDFFGLDLKEPSILIMPPSLMIMQFFQMKMTFARAKKKQDSASQASQKKKKDGKKEPLGQTEIQQRVMLYGLPLMIGFFAIKFPAAVSLYWGVSTVFAIGQQFVVNRRSD